MGGALLHRLLEDDSFGQVVSVGRRTLPIQHAKLTQVVTDFSSEAAFESLAPPEVVFSCLGTTIGKAGSREAFRKVDHDAVLLFARAARRMHARVFVHVSSVGADPRSRVFYSAVKGEVERDVARLGFPSVYALRPSILDGERKERRPSERLGLIVARALGPVLGKYRPSPVEDVVRGMVASARRCAPGVHVVEPGAILEVRRDADPP